ncbi:MAG: dihydrofolate reductase, partial [Balneolales bacterium]
MKLAIIVAHANNLVIGKDGKLPWHISEDLKHFKKRTMGKPLLMGRGVFEEFGGKPLPGREN